MPQDSIHHLLLAQAGSGASSVGASSPDWWGVLAGLHPVLTHFPIALIIVAAGVEFVGLLMRRDKVASFTVIALVIGGTSAMFSAWSGWSLADAGYGRGWQLELHRWLGVAAGLLGLGLSFLVLVAWFGRRAWATALVRALTFVCAIIIGVAAHFGGELVWGESIVLESLFPKPGAQPLSISDHDPPPQSDSESDSKPESEPELSVPDSSDSPVQNSPEKVPSVSEEPVNPEKDEPVKIAMVSFKNQIEPILDVHCWKCHGATGRARAGLRLVTQADFDRVLDEHPLVTPGSPEQSVLYEVVVLPRDDDDAMPPSGPGLSAQEIALLELWINQGGSTIEQPTDVGVQTTVDVASSSSGPVSQEKSAADSPQESAFSEEVTRGVEEASKLLLARGVPVKPISRGSDFLELNAAALTHRIDPPFGDSDLESIASLSPVLVVLDLAHTEVTDLGVRSLAEFEKLQKITLKGTSISEKSASVLAGLVGLERLNLFETQMNDAGLQILMTSSSLRKIFVGDTRVTASGVASARSANPEVDIIWSVPAPSGG